MVRIIILFMFFIQACSSVSFQSRGAIPVSLKTKAKHRQKVEFSGVKEFFLWGLVAPSSIVFVDEKLSDAGAREASGLQTSVFQTFSQKIYSIISFGFYVPKSYVLSAVTLEDHL